MARSVEEGVAAERHAAGVEELVADADEDEKERELQRVDDVVGDLRGDEVEAQYERQEQAGEGGGAEQGIDADDETGGERPGELAWATADAQEIEERGDDAALEEGCAGLGVCGIAVRDGGWTHAVSMTPQTEAPM